MSHHPDQKKQVQLTEMMKSQTTSNGQSREKIDKLICSQSSFLNFSVTFKLSYINESMHEGTKVLRELDSMILFRGAKTSLNDMIKITVATVLSS